MHEQILIIEDDEELQKLLESTLRGSYQVFNTNTGLEGLSLYSLKHPDMVILDLNLPDMDGLDICRHIRKKDDITSIIMISSRTEEVDRILGLELGADDYITKPFSIRELRSRVHAFFRKIEVMKNIRSDARDQEEHEDLKRNILKIDELTNTMLMDDKEIRLTHTESQLLRFLAASPGEVFSREDIVKEIWGDEWTGTDMVVATHIKRLRRKIETDHRRPECIETIHGVGYRLNHQYRIVFY